MKERDRSFHGGIVCRHVVEGSPVRLVYFDSDRVLQFLCGKYEHWNAQDYELTSLSDLMDTHHEIAGLPEMKLGQFAERADENSDWIIGQLLAETTKGN